MGGAAFFESDRVADASFRDDFHAGDDVADFARAEFLAGNLFELHFSEFFDFIGGACRHHADAVAGFNFSVKESDVDDDAAIGIVERVEDERLERVFEIAVRGRNSLGDGFEDVFDAFARFGARSKGFEGIESQILVDLFVAHIDIGGGEIDFIDDGDECEVVFHCHIEIGDGLRFDALAGVDEKQRAFARGEGARDFVAEIDVSRRVDEVEGEFFAVFRRIGQADRLTFNRDSAFAF